MYARISRLTTSPSGLEEAGRFEEDSVRLLCEHSGYRGSMLLSHPGDGTCVTITYWDSEEAMRACEDQVAARADPCPGATRSVERLHLIREA